MQFFPFHIHFSFKIQSMGARKKATRCNDMSKKLDAMATSSLSHVSRPAMFKVLHSQDSRDSQTRRTRRDSWSKPSQLRKVVNVPAVVYIERGNSRLQNHALSFVDKSSLPWPAAVPKKCETWCTCRCWPSSCRIQQRNHVSECEDSPTRWKVASRFAEGKFICIPRSKLACCRKILKTCLLVSGKTYMWLAMLINCHEDT